MVMLVHLTRWLAYHLSAWLILGILFACGGSKKPVESEINTDYSALHLAKVKDSKLVKVSDEKFTHYLKNGLRLQLKKQAEILKLAETDLAGDYQSRFSITNTHEAGVDEADRLKFDGDYLYVMNDDYFPADIEQPANSSQSTNSGIRIVKVNSQTAQHEEIAFLPYDNQDLRLQGMYLNQNNASRSLVTIAASRLYIWNDVWADIDWRWRTGKSELRLYHVDTPEDLAGNPQESWKLEIEGNYEGSRRVGNRLYLITHFIPQIESLVLGAVSEADKKFNEKEILKASLFDLLPHYQINDGPLTRLVEPDDCLIYDNVGENEGFADFVTVSEINLQTRTVESSICVNTQLDGIYASSNSLFLGASQWIDGNAEGNSQANEQTSDQTELQIQNQQISSFHQFDLDEAGLRYRATGMVKGALGWNDPSFFMSEYQGDFRVVTSTWQDDEQVHHLTVLRANAQHELTAIAQIPNDSQPQKIGKPGESIFAVRFINDKAYIVTFEQTDPLYQIDLSDPHHPEIISALEMPGFARYLHPLSEEWLLGIGHQVENEQVGGIKLELYQIPLNGEPQIKDTLVIGEQGSWSEALHDLRSISLLRINSDKLRIAIPVNRSEKQGSGMTQWADSGLYVFDIDGFDNLTLQLNLAGRLITETRSTTQQYAKNWGVGRSLLLPKSVYYLQGNQLTGRLYSEIMLTGLTK
ncbi:beta-propeller domain-containing protein [Aliikangiella maris]|uniref:Beta-propeller domain-containing protein n=2 Tax=Aliikangiella maris TaxID=3162458 RepID=A0ABV3MQK3_9GAMM